MKRGKGALTIEIWVALKVEVTVAGAVELWAGLEKLVEEEAPEKYGDADKGPDRARNGHGGRLWEALIGLIACSPASSSFSRPSRLAREARSEMGSETRVSREWIWRLFHSSSLRRADRGEKS